jgi:cell division septal protein FtsQ
MTMLNRRKRRQDYLLEVRVHQEGAARRRLQVALSVLAVLAVVGGLVYATWQVVGYVADRLAFRNSRFAITRIVVENEGVIDDRLLVRFAGARLGQNLLDLDLRRLERNLEMIPLLRHAEVRRLLPNTLVLHVDERVPVARLLFATASGTDGEFMVDDAGVVLKPLRLSDGTVIHPQTRGPLPVLVGLGPGDVQVGRRVQSPAATRALGLIEDFTESAVGSVLALDRIDVSKPGQITVVTRDRAVIQFAKEDYQGQLRRLAAVVAWARQRQKLVQTVDLTVAKTVPVTFAN